MDYSTLESAMRDCGLLARGGFRPEPGDAVPPRVDGTPPAALVMVGNAGPGMWNVFRQSPERDDGEANALDRWTRRVIGEIGNRVGAEVLFPFGGPPFHPFQRWAMRADAVHPSPIGPLIHAEFGLWHAYRAALSFAHPVELTPVERGASPCDTCEDRPCLSTCPVGAFGPLGYDVPACAGHIGSAAGRECLESGCMARLACPVGAEYRYRPEQAGFHMRAFLAARTSESDDE